MTLRRRVLLFSAFILVAGAAHFNLLRALFVFSRADESASHIMLIPFVSLALVVRRRDEIFASVRTAGWAGLGVVLAATGLMFGTGLLRSAGQADTQFALRVAALVALWAGGFLLFFGWQAFKAARFALAFLLFLLPMPAVVIDSATQLLKRASAEAVAGLFTLTATPHHREGFVFALPDFSIEVADACSGIRSSIALLLTALMAGHMLLKSSWKKAVLVAAIIPVVILKNGVRIVTLSLLATYVDRGFLVGRLHHDGGVVFFLLSLAVLMPVLAILRRSDESGSRETIRANEALAHHRN